MTFVEQLRDLFAKSAPNAAAPQLMDVVPPGEQVKYGPCIVEEVEKFGTVTHIAATGVGRTARILVFKDGKYMDVPGPLMIVEIYNQAFDKPSDVNVIGRESRSPDNSVVYRPQELPSDPQELKDMVRMFLLIKPVFLDKIILTTAQVAAEKNLSPVVQGTNEMPLFSGKRGEA
jgi:hypothetical protein